MNNDCRRQVQGVLKSVDVKADKMMNSSSSSTTSTDSSLFEQRVDPLNTVPIKSEANVATSIDVDDDESIIDGYDILGLDKWMNHDK